ncbi:ADP-ribosylglycohydrolase family protein [Thiospirillum jenense]|uniref:ADP-ribosylglycohydrolase family protein n=1 Tax=Thiospirillum jenense TaxID=1653858 RepID=A0A839HFK1_9GAMM|nr:ADP-ribosylglycohydrolase family protein [Thiospirillum jenense]MBB1127204.1 ADP-ribosylglycohydrolase family protein [Thiospirillum jenense]
MNTTNLVDKAKGAFFGAICGDALGTTLEFCPRIYEEEKKIREIVGGGQFNLPAGGWTDDTAMALCIAESLVKNQGYHPASIMRNFASWMTTGEFSFNHRRVDIGVTTSQAISHYLTDPSTPYHGLNDEDSQGNGSIMRLSPIFTYYRHDAIEGTRVAMDQSLLTHAHPTCVEYCKKCADVVYLAYQNQFHTDVLTHKTTRYQDVKSRGFVIDTYNAACYALGNSHSFEEAVVLAVNLGDDADTVGAVTGMFAGAYYGYSNIPERWVSKLLWLEYLNEMSELLLTPA